MKAIRLQIYQETANYRMPLDFDFRESLPLPAYSTVLGMIHDLCGYTKYHPMKLGISGSYASTVDNLQTKYEFGGIGKDRKNFITVGDLRVSRGIMHIQLLVDVNLTIHVVPSENDFETVYNALKNPREFVSLGRREDLAKMKVDVVDLNEKVLDHDLNIQTGFYLPLKDAQRLRVTGTYYDLTKQYERIDLRNYAIRDWVKKVPSYYVSGLSADTGQNLLQDDDGDVVFLA